MRVLILQDRDNEALARALKRAIKFCGWAEASVYPVCEKETKDNEEKSLDKSLEELLKGLETESFDILFLDAQLVYQGCEDSLYGGLELLMHIRLSLLPNQLSIRPIVLGTVDSVRWLIRQSMDHAILCSPGCEVVEFPAELGSIRRALEHCRAFTDYD